jgi:hypothetical protein
MGVNVFEGSRRIAWLVTAIATIYSIGLVVTNQPYVHATYSIAQPNAPLVRVDGPCPLEAKDHDFYTETKGGKDISIDLCLLPMSTTAKDGPYIPTTIGSDGRLWGVPKYSSELDVYALRLENQFSLPSPDDAELTKAWNKRRLKDSFDVAKYLAIGLATFWVLVWVVGWIVRGFLGIPSGMDRKP